jgi:hypothetical protein
MYTMTHLTIPARTLLVKDVFEVDELEGVGSSMKSGFLTSGMHFSKDVFVDRKPLDRLIVALAELFALRYTLVIQEQQDIYDEMTEWMERLDLDANERNLLTNIMKTNPAHKIKEHMEILKSHDKILAVYDFHLGLDGWPQDLPVPQDISSYRKYHIQRHCFTKSQCFSRPELTTSGKKHRFEEI